MWSAEGKNDKTEYKGKMTRQNTRENKLRRVTKKDELRFDK